MEAVTQRWVEEQHSVLAAGVETLDPDFVLATEAPGMWQAFDRIERLAASAKVLLARRVDDSGVWRRHGYKTPAEYLAAKAGTTTGRAREDLETSKRLPLQPQVTEACKQGDLSPVQAGAVSGAAAADPTAEGRLVEKATKSTVAELRDECARTRAAADPDPEATHRRIHQGRSLRRFTTPDGFWNLTARGTADDAARINAALDPIIEEIFGTARREGRREPHDAYAFDALVEMADRARTGQPADPVTADAARGDPAPGDPAPGDAAGDVEGDVEGAQRRPARQAPITHLALLRLDLEAMVRGTVEGDEC